MTYMREWRLQQHEDWVLSSDVRQAQFLAVTARSRLSADEKALLFHWVQARTLEFPESAGT